MTCDDCSKCKDCTEKEKIKYCKIPKNRTKLICRNFEFFETLDSFNKARLRYNFPKFEQDSEKEPEGPDGPEPPSPTGPEPPGPGPVGPPIVPKVAAFDSWRPSFKNASDIFNELFDEGYTIKEINDIMGNAELSLLNYHPDLHRLAYYTGHFVGPALMTGAAGKYAYEKLFRRAQIGPRDFTRFNPYDVEFPDERQSLIPKKVPKPSVRDPNFRRGLETTRVDFAQDRIPLLDDDPGGIEMPDIEDQEEFPDDLPDLEPVDEPPPEPPPGPPEEEQHLLGPKPDAIKREITKPEEKQPLLQGDDEGGIELNEPDPEPEPDPVVVEPEPSVPIDPFETALDQFKFTNNVTFTEGYQAYLRGQTKDLAPDKIRPYLKTFYDNQVNYFKDRLPILEGQVNTSFNDLKIAEGIVSYKNAQGAYYIGQLEKATSSRRPALLEQANKIKGELQSLNADLQTKLEIYKQNYFNYKKMVEDNNYFQGQDSNYVSTGMNETVINDHAGFTSQMQYRIQGLDYAANNAQNTIDQAETQGINWEGEQDTKVLEALDSYDETNGTKINLPQSEIEKIINKGGDYETSIGNYYNEVKNTQLNLINNQLQPLQTKFNNYKTALQTATQYNQEVVDEYEKFNQMKADGERVPLLIKQQQKIKTMLTELNRLQRNEVGAYTTYFNERNTFDAVYKSSNDAIKDVNSKYRPQLPPEITAIDSYYDDVSYIQSEITENLNTIAGSISRSLRDVQTAERLQGIKNYAYQTTLNEADAELNSLASQLNGIEYEHVISAKNALEAQDKKVKNIVQDLKTSEDKIPFVSPAQVDIEDMRTLVNRYSDELAYFNLKRAVLIEKINARNTSDAYTQLLDAGQSPKFYDIPNNATDETYENYDTFETTTDDNLTDYMNDWYESTVNAKSVNLTTTNLSNINTKISTLKTKISKVFAKLFEIKQKLKNPNLTDEEKLKLLANEDKQDKIITENKPLLESAQQERMTALNNDRTLLQQIKTDADKVMKDDFETTVPETEPEVYETKLNSLNEQTTTAAQDLTDTMNMEEPVLDDQQATEMTRLIKGDTPAFARIGPADFTSSISRAAKTMRSTRVLYGNLLGRLSATDAATSAAELDAVVDDASFGQKVLAGAGGLLAAGSSFVERGIFLAITKPALIGTSALLGPRIASMVVGGISRAMGPVGLLLTLAGVGFQIWLDVASQPPQNFMIKATNSTADNLVMPLPEGAPDSFRDTSHDQYGSYQTSSYLNYMKYYLNDTTKFQEAINGNYSAMEAYRTIFTGFPLVYHPPGENQGEGRGGMGGVAGSSTPGYYSVDYTNPTEGQAYSYFQLMYNSIKQEYNSYKSAGLTPEKAMETTITKYQNQVQYAQENNRPLYVSRYVEENGGYGYGSVNAYSEKDTARALAEFKQNPFIFAGLPQSTLQLMGLPDNINDPDFVDSDEFQSITQNNSYYAQQNALVEKEVRQASANAQVASFKKLISTIPPEQTKVREYFLYQLDQLQQDPKIASDLTGLNKLRPAYVPPLSLVQQDLLDVLNDPYYFSITAAWDAQTSQFTNIEDFNDDNINSLPSWFALDPTDDNEFDVSTVENAKLALETSLKQQLGLYDYNLATLGSEGGKIFQDTYTYNTNTLQNLNADLAFMKSAQGLSRLFIPGPDAKDLTYLYLSYKKQYDIEGVDDSADAAWQTIINQLQLAVNNGDQFRIYTELNPGGDLVNAASAMGALNSSQLAYYQALYNEDHTRYLGYSSAALLALGLNVNLANGELSPGETVGRNNEAVDPDLLAHFTSMVADRNAQLTQLEIAGVQYGQPIPVYETDGKFSGTWLNPSDSEYQSTFQKEFPSYIYRPTGYDPYGTQTQTDDPQDTSQATQPAANSDNNQE